MVRISNIKLIKILMTNSRMPYTRLAEMFGVSEAAIRKRLRKLEKDGIIRKYTVEVNPRKLGFDVNALIGIDTKPEFYTSVIEKLKNFEKIINMYSSAGDHMILIECWFTNSNELHQFVKRLKRIEGVTRVCPAIILEKIK